MLVSVHRSLTELFQQRQGLPDAEIDARISALRDEIEAHRERERALLGAALSAEEMGELAEQLGDAGLRQIALGEQRDGKDLIAHVIEAVSFID